MFIVQSPISVGYQKNGKREVIKPDTEVKASDFPSEAVFDRLCQNGSIKEVKLPKKSTKAAKGK